MLRAIVGSLIGLTMMGCGYNAGGVNIWEAVEQDDATAIEQFQAAEGDVNVLGPGGSTPLWTALDQKNRYSYEALLQCGADPNVIMSGKRVVTHWAAFEEDPWWLRLALEHGADPNLVNVGRGQPSEGPPLKFAIDSEGSLESVRLLVEHGADINEPFIYDNYPLADALSRTDFDVVLYLLDRGADCELAECRGIKFLDNFKSKYKNRNKWYLLEEDRAKLDEIHAWLKGNGVELDED